VNAGWTVDCTARGVTAHKKTSERAFEFSCDLIDEFRRQRPFDEAERLIWRELLRAGTSVGANSSESGGAQSDSDFIAKFQIALKEGKESLFWLRLLKHASPHRDVRVDVLKRQCDEIVSILVVSLRTAKANAAQRAAEARQRRKTQARRS
jgi:four helix bundle protein